VAKRDSQESPAEVERQMALKGSGVEGIEKRDSQESPVEGLQREDLEE
jgi:hypothetical protein